MTMTITMKRSREEDREIETLAMANCLILSKHIASQTSNSTSSLDRVYKCKTCNRNFRSFQALGGHRASHKRSKLMTDDHIVHAQLHSSSVKIKAKMHECSVCGLEFEMGQALGGHMRRHRPDMEKERGEEAVPVLKRLKSERVNTNMGLDLNLTPYENDLKFGYQIMSPLFTPFF